MLVTPQNFAMNMWNRLKQGGDVTFPVGGWSETAPYTNRVVCSWLTQYDKPSPSFVDDSTSEEDSIARKLSYTQISFYDSEDGYVKATCKYMKPTTDVTVNLKGVI